MSVRVTESKDLINELIDQVVGLDPARLRVFLRRAFTRLGFSLLWTLREVADELARDQELES